MVYNSCHGIMQSGPCVTISIEFFEAMTKVIDARWVVDVICINLHEAFDKIPYGRLIQKDYISWDPW